AVEQARAARGVQLPKPALLVAADRAVRDLQERDRLAREPGARLGEPQPIWRIDDEADPPRGIARPEQPVRALRELPRRPAFRAGDALACRPSSAAQRHQLQPGIAAGEYPAAVPARAQQDSTVVLGNPIRLAAPPQLQ